MPRLSAISFILQYARSRQFKRQYLYIAHINQALRPFYFSAALGNLRKFNLLIFISTPSIASYYCDKALPTADQRQASKISKVHPPSELSNNRLFAVKPCCIGQPFIPLTKSGVQIKDSALDIFSFRLPYCGIRCRKMSAHPIKD